MKTYSKFHTFVGLIAILTVSLPFGAIAQQNSVQIEAEAAAAQDAGGDINKLLWFGAGVGVCCIGGTIGGLTGGYVGNLISPTEIEATEGLGFAPNYGTVDINNCGPTLIGSGIGFSVGVLVPFIGIYYYQGSPPPERLLGKSPEYVEVYTKAYKGRSRWLRTSWAAIGATGGGCGFGLGLCLLGSI